MRTATSLLSSALVLLCAGAASAGSVEVKGVHLCCGNCVKGVDKALTGVSGVSAVKCDRDAKTVTFTADDDKTAQAGIDALAKGGFHGTATIDGKAAKFPDSGAKEDAKGDSLTVSDVHLCCGACVKAAEAAVKGVAGVSAVKCDRGASSVTVTGKDVSASAVVKALNDEGFHATIKE
jgi:copper chaperone CopZ